MHLNNLTTNWKSNDNNKHHFVFTLSFQKVPLQGFFEFGDIKINANR